MNLRYINDIANELKSQNSFSKEPFLNLVRKSIAAAFLQSKGYRYVTARGVADITGRKSYLADIEYNYSPLFNAISPEFNMLFFRTTILRYFNVNMAKTYLFIMNKIKDIAKISGPTFSFIHIYILSYDLIFKVINQIQD